jgi:hypothetical protein
MESTKAAGSALIKLVSGGAGATEANGGVVEQRPDPLQRGVPAALLAHHIFQERIDALPPGLAEELQSLSDLIRYAADRQLLGHDGTIAQSAGMKVEQG